MGISLQGTGASDGLFMGPVRRLRGVVGQRRRCGEPDAESQALLHAISLAVEELAALIERVEGEAQDILAFQLAMLEDDALAAPAMAAIHAGAAADTAWAESLDAEIAGYEASGDDYFRARSADLRDMRDRVLRRLGGEAEHLAEPGAVLVGDDVAPTAFLETDWSRGGAIALSTGAPRAMWPCWRGHAAFPWWWALAKRVS